jgi:hypothetical protein
LRLCHSRSGTIKIIPCSKAVRALHRPKLYIHFTDNDGEGFSKAVFYEEVAIMIYNFLE